MLQEPKITAHKRVPRMPYVRTFVGRREGRRGDCREFSATRSAQSRIESLPQRRSLQQIRFDLSESSVAQSLRLPNIVSFGIVQKILSEQRLDRAGLRIGADVLQCFTVYKKTGEALEALELR